VNFIYVPKRQQRKQVTRICSLSMNSLLLYVTTSVKWWNDFDNAGWHRKWLLKQYVLSHSFIPPLFITDCSTLSDPLCCVICEWFKMQVIKRLSTRRAKDWAVSNFSSRSTITAASTCRRRWLQRRVIPVSSQQQLSSESPENWLLSYRSMHSRRRFVLREISSDINRVKYSYGRFIPPPNVLCCWRKE